MKTLLLFCLVTLATGAQASSPTSHTLTSAILQEQRDITVYQPQEYQTSDKRFAVLYLLDGGLNGDMVASMLARLTASEGANPHIIVAIHSTDRLRDYAPTVNQDPRGPLGQGGGGDKFLDFIANELMPFVDLQYRTSDQRILAGHSVGGLLVMHSFQSRPGLFQGHMAFSPAVWWGAQETRKAVEHYVVSEQAVGAYLYMNIGSEAGEMRAVYDALEYHIARNRSLNLTYRTDSHPYVGHDLTLAAGLFSALTGWHQYQQKRGM
ncbi:alpha/beta hydrolase [Aestuariibacter halophilus]|uniref:Alpha/beta hydrolase n=1 Tax=Fluctibacter halophilus TaxID=226011 RepID=A0ABS8GCP3_9ALTE|nr:alpha/beta hydrolase-fold protein [Aestuariibacter halophilus]MCC2618347.1 alpha/beta hydrolase [Aestuariibacter halophilus]